MVESVKQGSPVSFIETDEPGRNPEAGIALCLSGGGYRAMLFHAGALLRFNELGYLKKFERISSVSGGSITAGVLGHRWGRLDFSDSGAAANFADEVIAPLREIANHTIDTRSILLGAITSKTVGDELIGFYRKYLFNRATLQDLPDRPRFVFNATNFQSKVLWRFEKPYLRDYRVGEIKNPHLELAVAVAASSAFPPFLSPVILNFENSDYTPNSGYDLQHEPFTTKVVLTDGGVYDNLGLETAWKRYDTILVSDGGGMYQPDPEPKTDWAHQAKRVLDLIDNQVRSLRKRQVIGSYEQKLRKGTYWGIWTNIDEYNPAPHLNCNYAITSGIAAISTRLKSLDAKSQERLINWGYAVCDAAVRRYYDGNSAVPGDFPYPDSPLS